MFWIRKRRVLRVEVGLTKFRSMSSIWNCLVTQPDSRAPGPTLFPGPNPFLSPIAYRLPIDCLSIACALWLVAYRLPTDGFNVNSDLSSDLGIHICRAGDASNLATPLGHEYFEWVPKFPLKNISNKSWICCLTLYENCLICRFQYLVGNRPFFQFGKDT